MQVVCTTCDRKNRFELEQSQVSLVGNHWKVKFRIRALTQSEAHLQPMGILVSEKVHARLLFQIVWQTAVS